MNRLFPLIGLTLSLGLTLPLCGCQTKAYRVNAEIPVACIRKPIRMVNCTPDLLKCERFELDHAKGCEILELK